MAPIFYGVNSNRSIRDFKGAELRPLPPLRIRSGTLCGWKSPQQIYLIGRAIPLDGGAGD
jgi:hypothetical protein